MCGLFIFCSAKKRRAASSDGEDEGPLAKKQKDSLNQPKPRVQVKGGGVVEKIRTEVFCGGLPYSTTEVSDCSVGVSGLWMPVWSVLPCLEMPGCWALGRGLGPLLGRNKGN